LEADEFSSQIKTHLQARANETIAVGHQHKHDGGMRKALSAIYTRYGIRGLWRGVSSAIPRVTVGSATQLTTFSWTKERISNYEVCSLTVEIVKYKKSCHHSV